MRLSVLFLALAFGWVTSTLAQSNDNFAGRLALSGASATAVSNNLAATRETNEPNHAATAAGRSLWWTWTAPTTGVVNFSTFDGSSGVTPPRALAVYTGDSLAALTEVGNSNDFGLYIGLTSAQFGALNATGASFNLPVTAGTTYQIAVDASTSLSGVDDGTVVLSINAPPTIVSPASVSAVAGATFQYSILASNNPTAYGAANLPPGLSVNTVSGQINGVLTAKGTYTINLSATGPGGTGVAALTLQVGDPAPVVPLPPVINGYAEVSGYVGTSISYYFSATGTPTSYTASNLPPGLSLDATYGQITGTPTQAGTYSVPITATNAVGTSTATVTFAIVAAPLPPVIEGSLTASATVGNSFLYYLSTYSEGVSATVTGYAATGLPPGLSVDSNHYISGTPTQTGVYPVQVSVTNAGGTRTGTVTITVNAPATPVTGSAAAPQLRSSATMSGVVGTSLGYALLATNTPTSYGASNLPPGLTVDTTSGLITGTPTAAGRFAVPVAATNSYGTSTGTLTFTIFANAAAATAAATTPVITSPASASGYMGQAFSYPLTGAYNGQTLGSYSSNSLTYSASGLPPGLTLSTSTAGYYPATIISGTPTTAGTYQATVSATLSSLFGPTGQSSPTTTATVTFIIKPGPVVTVPVYTSSATLSASVGSSLGYTPTVTGSPTSYAASGLPPGLSVNTSTGVLTGTPTTAGTYQTVLSATNGAGTGSATLTCIVAPTSVPLVTSYATVNTGVVGTAFTYTISTVPAATSFGASSLPPGLSLNASTGVISGTLTTAGVYTVPITASNAVGTGQATLTITVVAASTVAVPVITSDAAQQGTVGSSFNYDLYATNSPTSYTVRTLPPGLTFDATYGEIEGTPTTAGTYTVPVSATNAGGTASATVTLIIAPLPVPVFSASAVVNATVNSPFYYSPYAYNSPTSYAASGLPSGVTFDTTTGYMTGTIAVAGSYPVTISATNASGTGSGTVTINVVPTPAPVLPVITSAGAANGVVGAAFNYAIQATGSPTGYDVGNLPAGLAFNASTGVISGKPTAAGSYSPTLYATNATGAGHATLNLIVTSAVTTPPVITSASQVLVWQKEPFNYPIVTSPAAASFTASNLPAGVTFNTATGLISGTLATTGSYTVPITATNAAGTIAATVTITVNSGATAVATNPAAVSVISGQAFSFALTTNATTLYSTNATNLPPGLTVNSSTGVISGTPTTTGNYTVSTTQYTNMGYIYGKLLIVVATTAPVVPVISSPAGIGTYAGTPFAYYLQATNSPTSFTATNLPAGLSLNAATGLISGTPLGTGSYSVVVSAGNSRGTSASVTMSFYVSSLPYGVSSTSSAASVSAVVGSALNYTLVSSGGYYYYGASAANLPPGLSFNTSTGLVSGTPTSSGVYATTFTVPNASGYYSYPVVTFNVAATPYAVPLLTGPAGASGIVNTAFGYTVTASNGVTSLAATGLPAGLSFNAATGVISGAPTVSGTFPVALTATNTLGQGSSILTLTVAAVAPTAPTLTTSNQLVQSVTRGNASSVSIYASNNPISYAAGNLPPGLALNPSTGVISGTLTTAGVYPVTISATNGAGSVSAVVTYLVNPYTAVPVFDDLDAEGTGNIGVDFGTALFYASNYPTSYAASGLPPGLSLDKTTGYVTGTPTTAGVYPVNVSATNAAGTGSAVWTVVVADASGLRPVLSSASAEVGGMVGQALSDTLSVTTQGGGSTNAVTLAFTYAGLPPGMTGNTSDSYSIYLTGTPTVAGTYPVTITATTPSGVAATEVITFVITSGPPTVTSAAAVAGNAGSALSYTLASSGKALAFSASGLPPGLSLDPTTGVITGTPTATGTYAVPVAVTGTAGTGSAKVTFLISNPAFGGLSVITSAAQTNCQDILSSYYYGPSYGNNPGAFGYTITAINFPTSFSASGLPAGLTLNPATGAIFGQPLVGGIYQVPITATNAAGTSSAILTIDATATFPAITAALTATGSVGAPFGYQVQTPATVFPNVIFYEEEYGADPDPTIFAAVGLPPGVSIGTMSGNLSGTPTQAGIYPVTISATNRAGTDSAVVTLLIAGITPPTAVVPSFAGQDMAAGFVGFPLSYSLSASSATSYAVGSLPPGLALNPATGRLTGTPTQSGSFSVPVSATNAAGTTQATLTVVIDSVPPAPVIYTGAVANASVGVPFTYGIGVENYLSTPTVTAYGASNLPAGLNCNPQTGLISGTPSGPAGTYLVPISATTGAVVGNAVLTLTVQPAPTSPSLPLLATPAGTLGFLGNPLAYALGSTGFAPTSSLPAGLSFDAGTGNLAGYPTTVGVYQIPLAASGTGSTNGTSVLTLETRAPDFSLPRLLNQPSGTTVMQNGNASFTASAVGAPSPVYQWNHNGIPVAGANAPTLTLAQAQPADAGIYTLSVKNAAGAVVSGPVVLTVQQTYGTWQTAHFTMAEIGMGLAGDNVDYAGDGLPNLLKYALGIDPRTGAGGSLPVGTYVAADGAMQLAFTRDAARSDLDYLVEASSDLNQWTTIAGSTLGAPTANLGGALRVVENAVNGSSEVAVVVEAGPSPGASRQRFLRLRVLRP